MNRGRGRISILLALILGAVGIGAAVVLRPSAPPVVETPRVEAPAPGAGGGAGGWQPVRITPPPPPALRGTIELTVDQLYGAWGDPKRLEAIRTAETVRITGRLHSLRDASGRFGGIVIIGESKERNRIEITGPTRRVGEPYLLWETHPTVKDWMIVMRAFEQAARVGDMLMVETSGPNILSAGWIVARIEKIRIQAR